jgi:uncharacterized OB-fold protein
MGSLFHTGLPADGELQLLVCADCGRVNYPVRELCGNCLADALRWQAVDAAGTVQSLTELHYSLESDYAHHLPWRVASVKLDCGPVALAHLQPGVSVQDRVTLRPLCDRRGNRMLIALADNSHETAPWLAIIDFREDSP